jgi:mannose-6-phosphate isomerase-like protein (cupin superfamily)
MTDLSAYLRGATGDGVHWSLDAPGELHVNLVHLDAGHGIGEHVNEAVDVVIVVLSGTGHVTIDGRRSPLAAHVVVQVPRSSRRGVRAADDEGLDYLSIHRRRGPLTIGASRDRAVAGAAVGHDEGGDPACWAHLFDEDEAGPAR